MARFPVVGRLDRAAGAQRGTFTIDRRSGLVSVRPYRRRRFYVLPLDAVATMVCQRVIKLHGADLP